MTELQWIKDTISPETSGDTIELLRIIDEFDKFPNNFINATGKRLDILRGQMSRIIDLKITNPTVADLANEWLCRLDWLIEYGKLHGRNKWYQKDIRSTIRCMKVDMKKHPEKILNGDNFWYGQSTEQMMEQWRK
jgi:hypothetical protein